MRKLIYLLAPLALAGCNRYVEPPPPETSAYWCPEAVIAAEIADYCKKGYWNCGNTTYRIRWAAETRLKCLVLMEREKRALQPAQPPVRVY